MESDNGQLHGESLRVLTDLAALRVLVECIVMSMTLPQQRHLLQTVDQELERLTADLLAQPILEELMNAMHAAVQLLRTRLHDRLPVVPWPRPA